MNEGVYQGPYTALKKLSIPQPGQTPGILRVAQYEVFSFDGNEPIDINGLLRAQSIRPYTKSLEDLEK